MYSNDNRKDGSYTVAWTRRITAVYWQIAFFTWRLAYVTFYVLYVTMYVCMYVCMYGMCGCVCVIAHTHTRLHIE